VARPVGPLTRAAKWVRRNPMPAALGVVMAAATALSLTLAGWALREMTRADLNARVATEQREETELSVYAAKLVLSRAAWNENEVKLAHHHLEGCPERLRGWEFWHLRHHYRRDEQTFGTRSPLAGCLAWSPDGRFLASAYLFGPVRLWDARTGVEGASLGAPRSRFASVAWSLDGTRVAGGTVSGTIHVWDAVTREELLALEAHKDDVSGSRGVPTASVWPARGPTGR